MNGRYIDIDGFNTWYLDEGSGPTVVLLHGAALAVDAEITWFRTIEALRGEFRLVAPDQVGFGRTDMPPGGVYWNRHRRVDHALAFIERLGIRDACLVGHSEGAYMATRIAITAPHLASRLVIVTSGATAPYLGGDADREWMDAAAAAYNDPLPLRQRRRFRAHERAPEPERGSALRGHPAGQLPPGGGGRTGTHVPRDTGRGSRTTTPT